MARTNSNDHECIVVGAGIIGIATAYFLVQRGVDVTVYDRRDEASLVARPVGVFELNFLERLELEQLESFVYSRPRRLVSASSDAEAQIVADEPAYMELDVRKLHAWFLARVREAGCEVHLERSLHIDGYRHGARELDVDGEMISAPIVIDAMPQSLASLATELVPAYEIATEYYAQHEICDIGTARLWQKENKVEDGDALCLMSVEGGYSVINIDLDTRRGSVSVLGISISREAYLTARQLRDGFVRSMPWVGEELAAGGGHFALRPIRDSFVDDGLIKLSSVSAMPIPIFGSDPATGIYAGNLAANTAAACLQRGVTTMHELWEFNRSFQSTRSCVCASYQPFRAFGSGLAKAETKAIIESGLLDSHFVRDAMSVRTFGVRLPEALPPLLTFGNLLPVVPRLARMMELTLRFQRHWGNYPRRPVEFPSWQEKAKSLYQAARKLAESGDARQSGPGRKR